ncbi:hypothetical protein OUZ56_029708 [Daphnia magna]|uniref:Uncharacterized protein n=1 Tax=Daphnia magna TaxID=35525 RepID=A0ABR0B7L1_9CRUS|nr:hypothetical protein OUZ56_029708 [Daphnia magna]
MVTSPMSLIIEINRPCVGFNVGKPSREIRYHMESKRLKNEVSQKLKEEQHKLRKLSKMKKNSVKNSHKRLLSPLLTTFWRKCYD